VTLTKVEPTIREVMGSTLHYTIVSGTFDFTGTDAAGKTLEARLRARRGGRGTPLAGNRPNLSKQS
jgi:hypothetical protein